MANRITRRTVLRPTEPIKVGQWSIQVWCKIIGAGAGRFTVIATNPQGTQLTAHGLTHAMALDNIVKQLPEEPKP